MNVLDVWGIGRSGMGLGLYFLCDDHLQPCVLGATTREV